MNNPRIIKNKNHQKNQFLLLIWLYRIDHEYDTLESLKDRVDSSMRTVLLDFTRSSLIEVACLSKPTMSRLREVIHHYGKIIQSGLRTRFEYSIVTVSAKPKLLENSAHDTRKKYSINKLLELLSHLIEPGNGSWGE